VIERERQRENIFKSKASKSLASELLNEIRIANIIQVYTCNICSNFY